VAGPRYSLHKSAKRGGPLTSPTEMRILIARTIPAAGPLDLGVLMGNGDFCDFQLSLLTSWKLRRDSCILHVAARQQRLITALAIHGPRPRNYLVGLLWPESCESLAMESLRVSIHLVSRQVPGLLVNGGAELSLSDLVKVAGAARRQSPRPRRSTQPFALPVPLRSRWLSRASW
jgi:hypothetical protein